MIVVDDGSTDDSRAASPSSYEDRVTLVLKENGGQASALNAGIEHCEGDIVIFLDADDTLQPEAAARVAAAFAADPNVAKVQFRMEVIDAGGQRRPASAQAAPRTCRCRAATSGAPSSPIPFDLAWLPTSANAFRAERAAPDPADPRARPIRSAAPTGTWST